MKLKDLLSEEMVDKNEFVDSIYTMMKTAFDLEDLGGLKHSRREVDGLLKRYTGMSLEDDPDAIGLYALSPEDLSGMMYKMRALLNKRTEASYKKSQHLLH